MERRLLKNRTKSSVFEPVHCQKDYITDTVTVQFRGQFNGVKAWEYLKQSYPSFEGREIVHFEEPSNFRGLENLGTAVYLANANMNYPSKNRMLG